MEYIVVHESTLSELETAVMRRITLGWLPQGGVTAVMGVDFNGPHERGWAQAMTRTDIKPATEKK